MAQTIKLKRTATPSNVPTTAQLELGEVAINTYDGNVYIKKNDGADAIVKINANPSDLNYFVNGEGTVAGTWLGTDPDITSYYDGLVIWYRITINGAATTTLNINGLGAKTIYRYATAKLTTHWPIGSVIPLVYSTTLNGGSFIGGYDWSDGNESYTVRWNQVAKNGASIIHGYQLLMQGADNLMYPVTVGGVANSTTNVVQTAELRMGGQMLYYNSATDIAANGNISGSILYEGITSAEMEYWSNRNNSTPWATAYLPMYLVGTVNANGNIILDNSTTTAFLTQTLPTTADGKVYIQVGWTGNTTDNWRLSTHHPVFEFKDGEIRLYQKPIETVTSDITFLDNVKANFGTSSDLQIYHDGSNSYIQDAGTGDLIVRANNLALQATSGEQYAAFVANGSASLFYDNAQKLATTATGIDVTGVIGASGTVTAPTFNATSTASGGFQGIDADTITAPSFTWTSDLNTGMWHAGTDAIGFTTGGVNRITINSAGISGAGAGLTGLNGSNITTGTVAAARVATLNQSTTGNAATATALQTARTINGVSFNGTANITVADATKLPLAGGTATGTINAPTFNATSVTSGGFQGIDADTITAPSFTWTSDLDTGMWHAGVNQIGFSTAGVNRATIDSTGLFLAGTGNVTANSFYVGGATGGTISAPFTNGNVAVAGASTAYGIYLRGGTTDYLTLTNTLITANRRLYTVPNTSETATTPNWESRAQGSGNGVTQYHANFTNSTGYVNGRITTNNFGTTYATTSDYRVKEDLQEMENATERLLELKPINFKWVGSESRTDGFLAHEVKEVVHDAVVGEKDATETVVEIVVDEEGNQTEVTKIVDSLQALDQAKLVPLLVKTIQELEARIRALEAK